MPEGKIKEILEKLTYGFRTHLEIENNRIVNKSNLDTAISSLCKLFLEVVGEDKPELSAMSNKMTCSQCGQNYHSEDIGYNQAKAKIRKRIEELVK
jgi:hypothetical protein